MELLIFKIFLIVITIRIIYLMIYHLFIVFYDKATDDAVNDILNNPREYVRTDHMSKFMGDMIWFYIFLKLLWCVFSGNIIIN